MVRVLTTGLTDEQLAHLRQRLPSLDVQAVEHTELLPRVREAPCGLLIVGCHGMGRKNLQVLQVIRDVFDVETLPVIYILPSGTDAAGGLQQATLLRANQTLVEPYTNEDIARTAAQVLRISIEPSSQPIGTYRRVTRSVKPREWREQQASVAPRMEVLDKAARALDSGSLSKLMARSGVFECEKLRQFLSERGHVVGVRLLTELVPLFEGTVVMPGAATRYVTDLNQALLQPPSSEDPASEPPPAVRPPPPLPVVSSMGSTSAAVSAPNHQLSVLIVDADAAFAQQVGDEAHGRGLGVVVAPEVRTAAGYMQAQRVDVAVVDPVAAADWSDMEAFFGQLRAATPPIPVVLVTDSVNQEARLAAYRIGASLFLAKPQAPADVVSMAEELLGLSRLGASQVLVVDDDMVSLATVGELLTANNVVCSTISDPSQFWEGLERTQPDMLVLDIDMPHINGIELCCMVRSDPHWRGLPIMFLTGVRDAATLEAVYQAGADDLATKPIDPANFMARVNNRLERQRALLTSARLDALTGSGTRMRATDRFAQLLRWSQAENVPVSVAVVNLDLFQDVNVVLGFETGDAILRRVAKLMETNLPQGTLVSRWSGDEFVVGFYGQGREEAETSMGKVLDLVRQEPFGLLDGQALQVTFSCGVAQYPRDGTTLLDLYRTALATTAEVKRLSRNSVLSSSWFESPQFAETPLDLVVVMDDEALASRILTALGVRGVHGHWIGDGQSLLTRLLSAATARPDLVVVWGLEVPWMDGWAMLRLFQQDRMLKTCRLVVLTNQPTEENMNAVRQLGTFSVLDAQVQFTTLLHHLRQALAR